MTVYLVKHFYAVDGGYGDAIPNEDTVACFDNKEDADAFVEKYSNPHVYDRPYAELTCGDLDVEELTVLSHEEAEKTTYKWVNNGWGSDILMTEEECLRSLIKQVDMIGDLSLKYNPLEVLEDYTEELVGTFKYDQEFVKKLILQRTVNLDEVLNQWRNNMGLRYEEHDGYFYTVGVFFCKIYRTAEERDENFEKDQDEFFSKEHAESVNTILNMLAEPAGRVVI